MGYRFKLADLTAMTDPEFQTILAEIQGAVGAPRNGQAAILNARIRELETRHGMSSDEMRERLGRDEITETEEIARWLYLLDARDNRVRRQ